MSRRYGCSMNWEYLLPFRACGLDENEVKRRAGNAGLRLGWRQAQKKYFYSKGDYFHG